MKPLSYASLYFATACALVPCFATARDFPEKPIRGGVATSAGTTSAGTTSDLLIRAIAPEMSKAIGQALIIENRPGANQVIGLAEGRYVLRSPVQCTLENIPGEHLAEMMAYIKANFAKAAGIHAE